MSDTESIVWRYSESTVSYLNVKNIPILAIAGPSGAGKTYLATYLESKYPEFRIIRNYTTRKKRKTDDASQFEYISSDLFSSMQENNKFFLSRYKEFPWYGYSADDLMAIVNAKKIPIFMFRHSGTNTICQLIKNCYVIVIDTDISISTIQSRDIEHLATIESSRRCYDSINDSVNKLRSDHVLKIFNNYNESIKINSNLKMFCQRIIDDRV